MASQFFQYLLENIDSESPGDVTVAPGQTEAVMYFICDWDQIVKFTAGGTPIYYMWQEILGSAEFNPKNWAVGGAAPIYGGLTRKIPMSFPGFGGGSLYAYEFNMQPYSPDGKVSSFEWNTFLYNTNVALINLDYKKFAETAIYKKFRLEIKFKTRNYFILNDNQLENVILYDGLAVPRRYAYYNKIYLEKVVNIPAPPKTYIKPASEINFYYDFCEYLRYTEINVEPNNEIIVNKEGRSYWKVGPKPGGGVYANAPLNDSPLMDTNASSQFQTIIKNNVTIKWYQVPKLAIFKPQYILDVGKVNYGWNYDEQQNPEVFNYPFFKFANGTLLMTGIKTEETNFSFPILPYKAGNVFNLQSNLFVNGYYDLTFNMIQYVIPETQIELPVPAPQGIKYIPGSMYSNGWNMVPLPNNQFFYVRTPYDINRNPMEEVLPVYWSAPFQKLFNPQLGD